MEKEQDGKVNISKPTKFYLQQNLNRVNCLNEQLELITLIAHWNKFLTLGLKKDDIGLESEMKTPQFLSFEKTHLLKTLFVSLELFHGRQRNF